MYVCKGLSNRWQCLPSWSSISPWNYIWWGLILGVNTSYTLFCYFNPLLTIGNSLKKQKSLYKVLTPNIKPLFKFLWVYGSSWHMSFYGMLGFGHSVCMFDLFLVGYICTYKPAAEFQPLENVGSLVNIEEILFWVSPHLSCFRREGGTYSMTIQVFAYVCLTCVMGWLCYKTSW